METAEKNGLKLFSKICELSLKTLSEDGAQSQFRGHD